jgi:hypothetical protein
MTAITVQPTGPAQEQSSHLDIDRSSLQLMCNMQARRGLSERSVVHVMAGNPIESPERRRVRP